jgi:16S rRNA (cytosine967-C5)-methyltransferase
LRDGGRLAAAIAVLADAQARHKPARLALKSWGEGARYAGAKDRAFVSGMVLDVLRHRRSLAWRMGGDVSDRAAVLAAARFLWAWDLDRLAVAAAEPHGPGALTDEDRAQLLDPVSLAEAPAGVRGDYPDWVDPSLARVFADERAAEGEALAARAPTDLRVNTLKTDLARALEALAPFGPQVSDLLPNAVRIAAPVASERAPPVEVAPEYQMGWFEVQDLGSQIAAACATDIAGAQVLDYCAGGGGKTLALAAAMGEEGRLYAYDSDARRLTDTVRRAQRAGVTNLEVRSPIHKGGLASLEGRMDLVFVDAPCTGSGTWRRHPDTKWRFTPEQLARRMAEQDKVLAGAHRFVKPGGRLIYVTCSLLVEENEDRIAAFLALTPDFRVIPATGPADGFLSPAGYLRVTPRTAGTDGFFVAVLRRRI